MQYPLFQRETNEVTVRHVFSSYQYVLSFGQKKINFVRMTLSHYQALIKKIKEEEDSTVSIDFIEFN